MLIDIKKDQEDKRRLEENFKEQLYNKIVGPTDKEVLESIEETEEELQTTFDYVIEKKLTKEVNDHQKGFIK